MRPARTLAVVAAASLCASAAMAQDAAGDRVQVFGGGQVDMSSYGYGGFSVALQNGGLEHGLAVRAAGFGGDYSYQGGPFDGTVHATFTGAEVDGLYEFSGPWYWVNVGVGAHYVDTQLSPFDSTNRRHGAQVEPTPVSDGGGVRGPWRVDYYVSYGTRLQDYLGRVSLTHTLFGPLRLGGEVSFEGDPTYNLQRFGPYLGVQLGPRSEIQFSAGGSRESGQGGGGYFRVAVYRSF